MSWPLKKTTRPLPGELSLEIAELKKLKVMDGYHSWASMCWCELLIQIDTIQHIRLLLHWQVGTS